MKRARSKIFSLVWFCLFCLSCQDCPADMVYLKNTDNSIEGIIEEEDAQTLSLNMGAGRITLEKKDISLIQRYTPIQQNELKEKWEYKYFMRPEFIPDILKDLAGEFNSLGDLRDKAIESKRERDKIQKNMADTEKELQELNTQLAAASDNLSSAKPEEKLEEYNKLVNEFNVLVAKIKSAEYRNNSLQKEIIVLDKKISGFLNDFQLFRKRFGDRYSALSQESKEQNKPFLEGVKKELGLMENDFTKHTVDFNRYRLGIMVDAILNKIVKANLIVDTGASLTILSKQTADKLGGRYDINKERIQVTLADGTNVEAAPLILESIKVGDAEARNVRAAVLEGGQDTAEDGLLGMSFLENFVIRLDAKNNQLILEEFNP